MAEDDPKVAVVDDERHIRELLEMSLAKHGFNVRTAADGAAGLALVEMWSPDVVVLDVMMPKVDGLSVLPMIRRISESPILMLSAKGDVGDRVTGMRRGADDYISKPFDMDELVTRIRTALRRPHLHEPETMGYADVVVDVFSRTVRRGGRAVRLTSREFDLLAVLIRHPGRVFSRDHLLDRVWSERDVTLANVDTYISYLRGKIDIKGDVPLIHTVRGAGYTLRAP